MRRVTNNKVVKKICGVTGAGRKVGGNFQGELSEAFVEYKLRNKKLGERERIIKDWENIFQPWRKIEQIIVPHVSELFDIVSEGTPRIYKGVSYNPLIPTFGENTNILDFFAWLAGADFKGVVLDASLYAVVNAAQKILVNEYSEKAAVQAVEFLLSSIKEYPEIICSAETRGKYLRAVAISLFSPNSQPLVIDAETMWQSKRYLDCLQEAILFCAGNPKIGDSLEIRRYANYTHYNTSFQRWYSVLVLAEVYYLYKVYGVKVKLGPTTESNFDNLIRDFMKKLGIRYGFIWYDRGIEKQIPYSEIVFFSDDKDAVKKKMENKKLREWVKEMLRPFSCGIQSTIEKLFDTIRKVNETAEKNPPKLSVEGEWFLTFPPGACD